MKKFTKIMCAVLCFGFLLTGCATVKNIKNDYEELIYNGNSAVMVDGNLYYGNSFATVESESDYKEGRKVSYLARLNLNNSIDSEGIDYSPEDVETVSKEVVGHNHTFMFVLGKYVYYTTPNKQEFANDEGEPTHYYNYSTLYRSKLNGDSKKKILTTDGEVKNIEVLKYDGKYYVVILAGQTLTKVCVGNSSKPQAKVEEIATDVTSVAIPETFQKDKASSSLDWNGYVYYTTNKSDPDNADVSGTIINRVLVSKNDSEELEGYTGSISFVGRQEDVVFFTQSASGGTFTYAADLTDDNSQYAIRNNKKLFYEGTAGEISEIKTQMSEGCENSGYVFTVDSILMYAKEKESAYTTRNISFMTSEAVTDYNVLTVDGRTVYLSTTSGVFRADISSVVAGITSTVNCKIVTEMAEIYDGTICSFDGENIYFFAKLQSLSSETTDTEDSEETDDTYYLYRANVNKEYSYESKNYELLSMVDSRK
ncbi:MAG: hypothetical protein E7375_03875 [Clostridiales bacterium]|nr:hypothetical protein [Clostridiales bacterium]